MNKIFLKFFALLLLVILIFFIFIVFILSPNIVQNLPLSEVKSTEDTIINLSVLILIITTIFSFLAIKKLLRPIDVLTNHALKVRSGDFSVRNRVDSKDEFGILAKQFNFMLDELEGNFKDLEKKVELRTLELKNKLYIDGLTHLRNRHSLIDDITDYEFPAVVLVDIDHFDNINELYGFSTGNDVLRLFGERLVDYASENGYKAYRVYGNVFAILGNAICNFDNFERFVKKLSTLCKKESISLEKLSIDIFIEVTIGISMAQEEPLKTATIALKKAKRSNIPYLIYNSSIDTKEHLERLMFWKDKIKYAIECDKVVPFYQPIINRDQEIVKYETLMRIEDINKESGEIEYLLPYQFFDIAIQTKQFKKLSNMVISKAFRDIKNTDKMISINISFKDIEDKDFVKFLDSLISKIDDSDKKRLVFEILESDNVLDYNILIDFILLYKKQGIRVAIDDFGSGYSNFEHILRIRPDYLKIDGSLIKNIDVDKDSYELVKSIVEFSKALNIKIIAEFIHSSEVFEISKDLGIDEFQGFYFGKPELLFKKD